MYFTSLVYIDLNVPLCIVQSCRQDIDRSEVEMTRKSKKCQYDTQRLQSENEEMSQRMVSAYYDCLSKNSH